MQRCDDLQEPAPANCSTHIAYRSLFVRRLGIMFGALVLTYAAGFVGVVIIQRGCRWLGRLVIASAVLAFGLSQILFLLSSCRWTWNWWL